jgi:hypothetical protein
MGLGWSLVAHGKESGPPSKGFMRASLAIVAEAPARASKPPPSQFFVRTEPAPSKGERRNAKEDSRADNN